MIVAELVIDFGLIVSGIRGFTELKGNLRVGVWTLLVANVIFQIKSAFQFVKIFESLITGDAINGQEAYKRA